MLPTIITAVGNGELEIVKQEIDRGTNINILSNFNAFSYSEPPLYWVAIGNHFEIVKYLVEHGANINLQDKVVIRQVIQHVIGLRNMVTMK